MNKYISIKEPNITQSKVFKEVLIVKPSMFYDYRGNIYTSYHKESYEDLLPEGVEFIHDKFAESNKNVLRGLHGDAKTWKLVSCVWGEIYEVIVDMRQEALTYKKWESFTLKSNDYTQIIIPPRFINGYYVKSEQAIFHYKLAYSGEYFDVEDQMTYRWNDPTIGIQWPCTNPILQERDR